MCGRTKSFREFDVNSATLSYLMFIFHVIVLFGIYTSFAQGTYIKILSIQNKTEIPRKKNLYCQLI